MNGKPSDVQVDDFVKRVEAGGPLQSGDAKILRYLLVTIAAQGDMAARLSFRLDILNAFAIEAGNVIAGSGITHLQSLLGNPQLNNFTIQDARTEVDKVLKEIQQQTQVVEVLGSIAKFAVKFAPLLLA